MSGNKTTIVLPLFSALLASSVAAHTAAPEEIPISTPSHHAMVLAALKASSFLTGISSS